MHLPTGHGLLPREWRRSPGHWEGRMEANAHDTTLELREDGNSSTQYGAFRKFDDRDPAMETCETASNTCGLNPNPPKLQRAPCFRPTSETWRVERHRKKQHLTPN